MNLKEKVKKDTSLKRSKITMKKLKKQVKGITLIALVVTIIVLLILAGVALSLTVGENGLFRRAQNAANTWQMAEKNEQIEMEQAGNFLDDYTSEYNKATTVSYAKQLNKPFENDTTITDDLDNEVRIPAGFKIASDSATLVEDGIVIEDKDGNQFVWISAKTEAEGGATINLSTGGTANVVYKRTDFGKQDGSYSDYSETMPSDEEASVNANGGYYIGRYEAGDGSSTEFRTSETDGTVVIKKNQVPYNYISRANTEIKATEMATVQEYTTATTKLVSSYAWDTAISFIQIKNSDYGKSSPEGNYSNTDYGNDLIRTGQTTAVSNIYDMGGNLYERTTESKSDELYLYVTRGGNCTYNYDSHPAGYRISNTGIANNSNGFRVTLYCSTES